MAIKSGAWILWEREYGNLRISGPSRTALKKRIPIEEYLSLQGRFRNITPEQTRILQDAVDRQIRRLRCEVEQPCT